MPAARSVLAGRTGAWRTGRPRPGGVRAARLAGALLCAAPLRAAPAQDAPPAREVVELRFRGAQVLREQQLEAAIETRASRCRLPVPLSVLCHAGLAREREYLDNPAALDLDALRLRVLYFQRGYRDAAVTVDTTPSGDGIRVAFTIEEGRPVRITSLEVEGAAEFLPDDIARQLPLRVGDPLNLAAIDAARDSLIAALRNRGYPRADALIDRIFIPKESYGAEVRYLVIPGTQARFGPIEIAGDDRISEDVIRRLLTFREGDLYRHGALLSSQRNLFDLNVFQNVAIQPLEDAASDTVIPVRIQVNEGDVQRIRVGAGANTLDCLTAEGRWTSRNFLGGARRLEVRGVVANVLAGTLSDAELCHTEGEVDSVYLDLTYSASVDFSQPWFLGRRNALGAGLFVERRSLPGVFVRSARGGYLGLTRNISSRTSLSLGVRPELTELDAADGDLFFCVSFIACAVNQIDVLDEEHWLTPVTLSFGRDRTNSVFSPSRGYILRLETEYAPRVTRRQFAYARAAGDVSAYREIGHGVILASRLRGGWARSLEEPGEAAGLGLNPQKRFFAGGANSVRGFAQYRLGPKVLRVDAERLIEAGCLPAQINAGLCDPAVLSTLPGGYEPADNDIRPVGGDAVVEGSVELRFPILGERWRGAAFVDFGQLWQREAGDRVDLRDLIFTPGVGIRYNSPIGPIRVDVGYNTQGAETLPVITTEVDEATARPTNELKAQLPFLWDPDRRFRDRLQFHFSIGQAF